MNCTLAWASNYYLFPPQLPLLWPFFKCILGEEILQVCGIMYHLHSVGINQYQSYRRSSLWFVSVQCYQPDLTTEAIGVTWYQGIPLMLSGKLCTWMLLYTSNAISWVVHWYELQVISYRIISSNAPLGIIVLRHLKVETSQVCRIMDDCWQQRYQSIFFCPMLLMWSPTDCWISGKRCTSWILNALVDKLEAPWIVLYTVEVIIS